MSDTPRTTAPLQSPDFERRVFVEQRLLDAFTGKKPLPTREECRELAHRLGIPDDARPQDYEAVKAERDNLYRCVKWYADGNHAELPDWEAPDEPNWICPPSEIETTKADHTPFDPKVGPKPPEKVRVDINESWMVEDGGIARFVLAGGALPDDMDECEESFRLPKDAKPLAAPATASKGHQHG